MSARECYLAMLEIDERLPMMNIKERRTIVEPMKVLEEVPLDESNQEKFIGIKTSMEEKIK